MLIPNSLGPNPKQLLINNELTHSLSMQNTSKICTALNKQMTIIHLDKKFPTFFYNMFMPHSQKSTTLYYPGLNESISHLSHFSSGL